MGLRVRERRRSLDKTSQRLVTACKRGLVQSLSSLMKLGDGTGKLLLLTVEVSMLGRLVTYYVLIVIELSTRRVHVAGITPTPDSAFMMQVGRNLTHDLR